VQCWLAYLCMHASIVCVFSYVFSYVCVL